MKEKNTAWKGLLKTFVATTFSILLTFGTASIIERNKQAKEKRQIVLMLMYDFDNSLKQARHCDSLIQGFVEAQTHSIETLDTFDNFMANYLFSLPSIKYTETIENIFSSNIESINTIGNVHFVERVSEFYRLRKKYSKNIDEFVESVMNICASVTYEDMVGFNSFHHFVVSSYVLADMEHLNLQCRQIMKVTDEELEVFYQTRQQIEDASGEKENVWETKIPQMEQPWMEAMKKGQKIISDETK